jgi:hypothetical protein
MNTIFSRVWAIDQTSELHLQPTGPSRTLCVVSTVNEFLEQASVLKAEIPNTEAALFFGEASFVPADQALSARDRFLTGPQEGPPTRVQGIITLGGSCTAPMA